MLQLRCRALIALVTAIALAAAPTMVTAQGGGSGGSGGAPGAGAQGSPGGGAAGPQAGEAYGEEVTLTGKPIVYMKGESTWEEGYENLVEAFKTLNEFVTKQGLKVAGMPMAIYTASDDSGFDYQAAIPLEEAPKNLPQGDILVGTSPEGKALKFGYKGSYSALEDFYIGIANYFEEKNLDSQDLFVEEYLTDPTTTPSDKIAVTIFIPVK